MAVIRRFCRIMAIDNGYRANKLAGDAVGMRWLLMEMRLHGFFVKHAGDLNGL